MNGLGGVRRVAVLVAVALLATGCTGSDEPRDRTASGETSASPAAAEATHELGHDVLLSAPDGAFSDNIKLAAAPRPRSAAQPVPGFALAGGFEITASAQPTSPVTLRLPVQAAAVADLAPGGEDGVVVLHQHGTEPIEPLIGTLDRANLTVTVTTTRLSWFDVLLPSVKALRDQVGEIANGALGGVGFSTKPPRCDGESEARAAGYRATSTRTDVLRWCLGLQPDGSPVVRAVLNRRYPMLATVGTRTRIGPTTTGQIPVQLAQALTTALSQRQVTLSPGGTSTFLPTLSPGQDTSIRAEFDGFAHSLMSLQIASELILAIAGRLAGKSTVQGTAEFLKTIDAAECAPKLADLAADPDDVGRVGAMVSACLDPDSVTKGLGRVVAKIVTVVLALVGSVIAYLWTSTSALADLVRGKSNHTLTVRRALPGVTVEQLRNATVPAMCDLPAGRLKNGTLPVADPSRGEASLVDTVIGDLTGDGIDEGLAITACTYGGTATYTGIYAYTSGPKLLGRVDVEGKRTIERDWGLSLSDVRITDGRIEVDALDGDEDDPICCPSVYLGKAFDINDGQLKQVPAAAPGRGDRVTVQGWGSARVGMTYAELAAATGLPIQVSDYEDSGNLAEAGCTYVSPTTEHLGFMAMGGDGEVGALVFSEPGVLSRSGVGVGSTEAQVLAAYGTAVTREDNEYVETDDIVIAPDNGSRILRFEFDDDKRTVTRMHAGERGWAMLIEGCA